MSIKYTAQYLTECHYVLDTLAELDPERFDLHMETIRSVVASIQTLEMRRKAKAAETLSILGNLFAGMRRGH
jgi:hypothetical protein